VGVGQHERVSEMLSKGEKAEFDAEGKKYIQEKVGPLLKQLDIDFKVE
jgi:hypothetical protein